MSCRLQSVPTFSSRLHTAAALLLFALAVPQALAQTYLYSGGINEIVNGATVYSESYQGTLPGQLGKSASYFPPDYPYTATMRAQSGAGPGFVVASTFAQFIKTTVNDGGFTRQVGGIGFAKTIWSDVFVNGTPGMVPARVRFHMTGSLTAGTSINPRATATVQVLFRIHGQDAGGGSRSITVIGGTPSIFSNGLLSTFDGDEVIESAEVMVPANTAVELEIQLTASTNTSLFWAFSGDSSALADFSHTVTLATDRPVFNVPAGYTVNSVQARIVNNTFALPCPADLYHDTLVDDLDFSEFAVAYNILDCADPAMLPGCAADLNNDGLVDDADFSIFAIAYDKLICD
jgi:hypothetical protein